VVRRLNGKARIAPGLSIVALVAYYFVTVTLTVVV